MTIVERAVLVLEDFEDVASLLLAEWRQAPVVEHEDVDLREPTEQTRIGAVGEPLSRTLDPQAQHESMGGDPKVILEPTHQREAIHAEPFR